ncbi:MAG: hypothetical protein ABJE10_21650 [bacterium]
MRIVRRLAVIVFTSCAPLFVSCATPAGGGATGSAPASSNDVITQRELADPSLVGVTVLDAVRRLRPRFLVDRPGAKGAVGGELMASVDGHNLVTLDELGRISASEVSEIRFLSASEAGQKFGTRGAMGAVITVTLRVR